MKNKSSPMSRLITCKYYNIKIFTCKECKKEFSINKVVYKVCQASPELEEISKVVYCPSCGTHQYKE